jgi:hypothetical protein
MEFESTFHPAILTRLFSVSTLNTPGTSKVPLNSPPVA